MPSPTVDIIVPVWNHPFETRACLAAILEFSPDARLIIVDNGSSRETELMLEEFSEPLGEKALFITTERNIGLVPAINRGLASSDGDFAIIVRPNVIVSNGWLRGLLDAGGMPGTGIVSPVFRGSGAPPLARPLPRFPLMETFSLSFATLLIKGELLKLVGGFDEGLDNGEWCLRDYLRRAETRGYHTCVIAQPELVCSRETVYGSPERRQEQIRTSHDRYLARWGVAHHYCLYFGSEADAADFSETLAAIAAAARKGHRFTLLLHRRQFNEFRRRGWIALHTAIVLCRLPILGARRSLERQFAALQTVDPDLIPVRGAEDVEFPGAAAAICLSEIVAIHQNGCSHPAQWDNALEVE
ncbi:MAG: glycosyltransferase [Desulfuromonadales bacterium]|nr:glycosyltransferase [Desulfuromonadales bacterium]